MEYSELQSKKASFGNKRRKEMDRRIAEIQCMHKCIDAEIKSFDHMRCNEIRMCELREQLEKTNTYFQDGIDNVLQLLQIEDFVQPTPFALTSKGVLALKLREVHCLVFANIIHNAQIDHLSAAELVGLFSCFTNISVCEECNELTANSDNAELNRIATMVNNMYDNYHNAELQYGLNTGIDYNLHFNLLQYAVDWCHCNTSEECKLLLQRMSCEKEIFLGEFVKALLKINNIAAELETIAESLGNIAFLSKMRDIQTLTLKYVVTNQSLYA